MKGSKLKKVYFNGRRSRELSLSVHKDGLLWMKVDEYLDISSAMVVGMVDCMLQGFVRGRGDGLYPGFAVANTILRRWLAANTINSAGPAESVRK
jgi:hypothetical protein